MTVVEPFPDPLVGRASHSGLETIECVGSLRSANKLGMAADGAYRVPKTQRIVKQRVAISNKKHSGRQSLQICIQGREAWMSSGVVSKSSGQALKT